MVQSAVVPFLGISNGIFGPVCRTTTAAAAAAAAAGGSDGDEGRGEEKETERKGYKRKRGSSHSILFCLLSKSTVPLLKAHFTY